MEEQKNRALKRNSKSLFVALFGNEFTCNIFIGMKKQTKNNICKSINNIINHVRERERESAFVKNGKITSVRE